MLVVNAIRNVIDNAVNRINVNLNLMLQNSNTADRNVLAKYTLLKQMEVTDPYI